MREALNDGLPHHRQRDGRKSFYGIHTACLCTHLEIKNAFFWLDLQSNILENQPA